MSRSVLAWILLLGAFACAGLWTQTLVAQDDAAATAATDEKATEDKAAEASKSALPVEWAKSLHWRSMGPANMGGRITAIAVNDSDPCMWWIATASGGLLKTVNNGISFEHQFDHESTVSIGDVQVSQSDPNIVWVGTGESNPRNSVSWGDGVYKSTDGGKTWKNMGLRDSFQIGRIAVHPTNPDVVYVGALGRLYGANEERGLYKTEDGGATWKKVLHIDDKTGIIELRMHPTNPATLLAATYERKRDGFDTNDPEVKYGEGSGIYKTTDGGQSWKRITEGLPSVKLGRIGIDYYRKDPNIVYMVLESERVGKVPENAAYLGAVSESADVGARITSIVEDSPAAKAGLEEGDIVIAIDNDTVHSNDNLQKVVRSRSAGETVKLEISRNRESVFKEVTFTNIPKPTEENAGRGGGRGGGFGRRGGGRNPYSGSLGGQRENMQDQQGREGHQHGGVYRSEDGGDSWTRIDSVNPRPMYFSQIRVDPSDENHIFVLGVSLYRSKDRGKTFTGDGGRGGVHVDHHALWIDPRDGRHMILGNDGGIYVTYDRMSRWDHYNHVAIGQFYHVGVSSDRNYSVYGGLQDNGSWGSANRVAHGNGPTNNDWLSVGGGDGFVCLVDPNDPNLIYTESQNGAMGRRHLLTGERGRIRPQAPRGTRYRFNWNTPFILSHHNSKIYYTAGNHVFKSLDRGDGLKAISPEITATERGSATALAESPRDADVLYVGTDDGAFWMTKNGGHDWISLYSPRPEPSPADVTKTVFVSITAQDPDDETADDPPPPPTRRQGRGQFLERIKEMDANGDGKIEKSEVPEQMQRMFGRLDTNSDGVIDAKELEAFASSRQGRGGMRRGGGEEGPGGEGRRGRRGGGRAQGEGRGGADEPTDEAEPAVAEAKQVPGLTDLLPGHRWVSYIEPSRYETGRCYVAFDGHRSDDDEPHIYVSEDFGETWRSLSGGLPEGVGSTRVIQEDITNPNVLYLGTEFAAWVSIDRGETWTKLNGTLPTVAVHDLAQHPTSGEMVAATHGRSLWVLDVAPLRQITTERVASAAHLYKPTDAIIWRSDLRRGSTLRRFVGQNPTRGAPLYYSLGKKAENVSLRIESVAGEKLRDLEAKAEAGLHRVVWDLRRDRTQGGQGGRGGQGRGQGTRRGGAPAGVSAEMAARFARFRGRGGASVRPGEYVVVLEVDGEEFKEKVTVAIDPDHADGTWLEFEELEEEIFFPKEEGEEEELEDDSDF